MIKKTISLKCCAKELIGRLINIIYPPRCPVCMEFLLNGDRWNNDSPKSICAECRAGFQKISSPLCPICGIPFTSGEKDNHLCEDCLRKRPFYDRIAAPYLYKGTIVTAIHKFKYGQKRVLADYLGPLLAGFAVCLFTELDNAITIPVPLHPKRLRERGFNQSLLIARYVANELKTGIDFLSLIRVRYTSPQTGLIKNERKKNVRGAFKVINPNAVKGKMIFMIDDVATTGNTLNECARTLKMAGCREVFCLVIARTPGIWK